MLSNSRSDKRFLDNPYPDFHESALTNSYLDSATFPNSDNGYRQLSLESSLGKKIQKASQRCVDLIHEAYFCQGGRRSDHSVYTGLSGILYSYHVLGNDIEEPWIQECLQSKSLKKRLGYLGGISGPLAFAASYSSQKSVYLKELLALKESKLFHESPEEFLYGKAGFLFALLLVKKNNPEFAEIDDVIESVISVIVKIGSRDQGSLYYEWHGKEYLGAAHGYAGILSSLLRARSHLSPPQLDMIRGKIEELILLQYPSGNFPSSISSSNGDRLVHWCHGAPGFVDLYLLSYDTFQDHKYLQIADKCLDVIWERGLLKKGFGLCHGSAGNGYAFLLAYKATKNTTHLYRALRFAEWCSDFENPGVGTPDRPYSLFEGLAGNAFFLHHIQQPLSEVYFPCYSI
uniref:LanC-like protein 1 n=1 Tax=Caligus clemensi TaxID=344056 RepID=C1C096_CALCM|nr:LanC-like protein 1 [Caligus clemensi]